MANQRYIARSARARLDLALTTFRVVQVTGARQVGKTTLALHAGGERRHVTFDDPDTRAAAEDDPAGFLDALGDGPVLIDEVQRVPETYLAIKRIVDEDPTPGRFLLTGSADPLSDRRVLDSLAGRIGIVELRPFSQGELHGHHDRFIARAVADEAPTWHATASAGLRTYLARIERGGYPEPARMEPAARALWLDSYVETILARDVRAVVRIDDLTRVRRLLSLVASHSGQLLKPASLARDAELAANTARTWLDALALTRLVDVLPAWSGGRRSRLVSTPRAHVLDSALHLALLGVDVEAVPADPMLAGPVLETFVVQELLRQRSFLVERPPRALHYRDRDQREVDLVLERPDGGVIGIEVKASARVRGSDLAGLRALARAAGDRWVRGIVLACIEHPREIEPGMHAVPVAELWHEPGGAGE